MTMNPRLLLSHELGEPLSESGLLVVVHSILHGNAGHVDPSDAKARNALPLVLLDGHLSGLRAKTIQLDGIFPIPAERNQRVERPLSVLVGIEKTVPGNDDSLVRPFRLNLDRHTDLLGASAGTAVLE